MSTCPVLPDKPVKKCIIGAKYIEEINELTKLGIECITFSEVNSLSKEINSHADIQCFNCGNNELLVNAEIAGELTDKIKDYNIIKCENITSPYPDDVKLNASLIADKLICNTRYVADEIKVFCKNNGVNIIHANQGYAKCSLCVVSENAVITEDDGLAYLLKNYQFNILKIQPGYVYLSEKHHGFIGGASGKISENELYFSGDLSRHPDYSDILSFLKKYNVKPIFNNNRILTDFGGFISV